MKLLVLGLSLSSAWGNGHATTWRALLRAVAARGHQVTFLERDMPWYAAHRDLPEPDFCRFALYRDLDELANWRREITAADAVIVGSYVPDGIAVGQIVQRLAAGVTAFYDIDTPVTLAALARGTCDYLSPALVAGYDLYLSFTGGPTLEFVEQRHGAPAARVLHCSADPEAYRPLPRRPRWDLSYLGTWSADRQPALERLLIEPARRAPELRFVVAGAQYPDDTAWPANVERIEHVPPAAHPDFYAESRFTLNVTRAEMVRTGWSPSVRLFEAASCATPVISDPWPGLATLFAPGKEILIAHGPDEVLAALTEPTGSLRARVGGGARRRVLAEHTPAHRAAELEAHLREARDRRGVPSAVGLAEKLPL